jgi:hypothetical protein
LLDDSLSLKGYVYRKPEDQNEGNDILPHDSEIVLEDDDPVDLKSGHISSRTNPRMHPFPRPTQSKPAAQPSPQPAANSKA